MAAKKDSVAESGLTSPTSNKKYVNAIINGTLYRQGLLSRSCCEKKRKNELILKQEWIKETKNNQE